MAGVVITTAGLSALSLAGFNQPSARAGMSERTQVTQIDKKASKKQKEAEPSNEYTLANTDKGYLEINGKRVFPRFSWNADSAVLPQLLNLGINVFAGVSDPDKSKFTSLLGNNAYYMGQYGEDMLGLPRTIGVMADEPDGYHLSPDNFNHPETSRVGAMTFTQHFRGDDKEWDMTPYPLYRTKASIFGVDDYLANRYDVFSPGKENKYNYIGLFYDIQRDLVRYANGGVTYGWIETGKIDSESIISDMQPEWINTEAGLMLAGGAKGIGWWTNTWPDGLVNKFDVSPKNQAIIKALNGLFDRYTQLFTSDILDVPEIAWDNPVKIGIRKVDDNRGVSRHYVIVANASNKAQNVNQVLPGLDGQGVKIYLDNSIDKLLSGQTPNSQPKISTYAVKNKRLTGQIQPYQWVVLEYVPDFNSNKITLKKSTQQKEKAKPLFKNVPLKDQVKIYLQSTKNLAADS